MTFLRNRNMLLVCIVTILLINPSMARESHIIPDSSDFPTKLHRFDINSQKYEHKPGELLVKYNNKLSKDDADNFYKSKNMTLIKDYSRIGYHLIRVDESKHEKNIEALSTSDNIENFEPNYIVKATRNPNDLRFSELWALDNTGQTGGTPDADIDAPQAWDISTGSKEVIVAVIDTGVDYTHEDLAGNMWRNTGEIPGNGIDDDNNGFIDDYYGWDFAYDDNDPVDGNSHGTHVSGIIGGVGNNGKGIAGVSWNTHIMAVKFLNDSGYGYTSDAIDAINYATMMGADIMSNSWAGGGYSSALEAAIRAADSAGSLFVAASGNDANNTDKYPTFPSGYDVPNVISIAATDHNDNLASFSNYGTSTVDIGAPGVDILSSVPDNGYSTQSGTSMAVPHVSGAAALLKAFNPSLTNHEIKEILMKSVDPIPSLYGKTVTGGRLNIYKALKSGTIVDLIKNPGFESGTNSWLFYTNGAGTFTATSPGYEGNNAAKLTMGSGGTNIQLYQKDVTLDANTRYQLSFAAYSTTGHDVTVRLIKHDSPYTAYAPDFTANLGNKWKTFTTEFTTSGFPDTVNDGRLQFWLGQYAVSGDTYYIDDVRLEKVSSTSPIPLAITTHPADQTVYAGQTATFNVVATGKAPLSYQWQKNSVNIPATGASYKTPATILSDSGSTYRVRVTNSAGSTMSNAATLTVSPATSNNIIRNSGFESGTTSWLFYTSGAGTFTSVIPGFKGIKAGKVALGSSGTNIQLYQTGLTLEHKTRYRLSFSAYSTNGHDMTVRLFKHGSPYTAYAPDFAANLGSSWQNFTTEFTTSGFTGMVNDGRLQFWLAGFAAAGDVYCVDDIILEEVI